MSEVQCLNAERERERRWLIPPPIYGIEKGLKDQGVIG